MKKMMIALLLTFSTPAFADYFHCELTNGFNKTEVEAEYQVREASIVARPFVCQGNLLDDAQVMVTISSTEVPGDYQSVTGFGTMSAELTTLDIHGDGQDTGVCKCGLR